MSDLRRLLIAAAVALLLTGWGSCQRRADKPVIVEVPGPTRYVDIPAEYTRDCPIEQAKNASPLEAPRVAKARKDALEACNRDKAKIRALQGTPP